MTPFLPLALVISAVAVPHFVVAAFVCADCGQKIAGLGSWEWDLVSDENCCSDEQYRIFG